MEGFDKVRITSIDGKLLSEHPEIVEQLQKAYNDELLAWLAYEHLKHMFFGPWGDELRGHFSTHANEEKAHAEWIGGKLAALGEVPQLNIANFERINKFKGTDYKSILEFVMQLEGEAVSNYNNMLSLLSNNAALRTQIENYATTEQEHFEDFEKFIRILPELKSDATEAQPKSLLSESKDPSQKEAAKEVSDSKLKDKKPKNAK